MGKSTISMAIFHSYVKLPKVSTKIYLKYLESWRIPILPPNFMAQDLDQTLAMAGTFVGTVTYMSPERCLGAMRITGVWRVSTCFDHSDLRRSLWISWEWYHLVMTNSLPWKDPPFSIGKPSISTGHLYHGYVSHSQRVVISVDWDLLGLVDQICIIDIFMLPGVATSLEMMGI